MTDGEKAAITRKVDAMTEAEFEKFMLRGGQVRHDLEQLDLLWRQFLWFVILSVLCLCVTA